MIGYLITACFYAILFHLIKSTYSYSESDFTQNSRNWKQELIYGRTPSVKKRFSILYWILLAVTFLIPGLGIIVSIILSVLLIIVFNSDEWPDYNYRAPKFIKSLLDKKF